MDLVTELAARPTRPPTIYDVAREAGVSSQTVVRYLNGFSGITAKTQTKVRDAIDLLGYRPNQFARALRMSAPHRILLFVHEIAEAGPANIILAAHAAASRAGYVLEIVSLDSNDVESTARIIRETDQSHVAGALAFAPTPEIDALFNELPQGIPLLREVNGDGLEGPVAQSEDDLGTRLQLEHLHALGHRRIAILTGPLGWFSSEKRYRTALRRASAMGMTVTGMAHGDWTAASGYASMRDVGLTGNPTAVLCGNDEMAMGALLALDEMGVSVPADISIIGYDDIREAAFFRPPLSTIKIDFEASGRLAVQRLLTLIADYHGTERPAQTVEPTLPSLVARRSTTSLSE